VTVVLVHLDSRIRSGGADCGCGVARAAANVASPAPAAWAAARALAILDYAVEVIEREAFREFEHRFSR